MNSYIYKKGEIWMHKIFKEHFTPPKTWRVAILRKKPNTHVSVSKCAGQAHTAQLHKRHKQHNGTKYVSSIVRIHSGNRTNRETNGTKLSDNQCQPLFCCPLFVPLTFLPVGIFTFRWKWTQTGFRYSPARQVLSQTRTLSYGYYWHGCM